MSRSLWIVVGSFVTGALLSSNGWLWITAGLLATVGVSTNLWGRLALGRLEYERSLGTTRLFVGDSTSLEIRVTNLWSLPLPWLLAEDRHPSALRVTRDEGAYGDKSGAGADSGQDAATPVGVLRSPRIRMLLSLGAREQVYRRYVVAATQRGNHEFGPVQLRTADLLGFRLRRERREPRTFVTVLPPCVSMDVLELERVFASATPIVLAVDLSLPPASDDPDSHELREFILSVAASIASHQIQRNREVGLCSNGVSARQPESTGLAEKGGTDQLEAIYQSLSSLAEGVSMDAAALIERSVLSASPASRIVWISAASEPGILESLEHLSKQFEIVVIRVGSSAPVSHTVPTVHVGGIESWRRLLDGLQRGGPATEVDGRRDAQHADLPVSERSYGSEEASLRRSWFSDLTIWPLLLMLRLIWLVPWLGLLYALFVPHFRGFAPPLWLMVALSIVGYTLGGTLIRRPTQREGFPWLGGHSLTLSGFVVILLCLWSLDFRSVPIWDPAWIRQLGTELLESRPLSLARTLFIVSLSYLWVGSVLDAEDPIDHQRVWNTFLSGLFALGSFLFVWQKDPGGYAAMPAFLIGVYFVVGLLALGMSGARLGRNVAGIPSLSDSDVSTLQTSDR